MSGYVASARMVHGTARLARSTDHVADRWTEPVRPATPDVIILDADAAPEPVAAGLVERVRAVRDRWSQLTFFLFDPNSWR